MASESIINFSGPLDLDSDVLTINESSLSYAEHRLISAKDGNRLLSTNELGNELGFTITDELEDQIPSGVILGHKSISNFIVLFIAATGKSIIGMIDIQANTYTNKLITNNPNEFLNFSNSNVRYVKAELRFDNNNNVITYFVDGYNKPKKINLTEATNKTGAGVSTFTNQIDFDAYYNLFNIIAPLAYIDTVSISDGGNLLTTVFQFAIRHKYSVDVPTSISSISNPIPVVEENETSSSNIYDGNLPGTIANKTINFTIKNINTTFRFIDLIVIYFDTLASQIKIGIIENIPITGTSMTYSFGDINSLNKSITINELVQSFASYDSAGDIIQKDSTLILAKLKKQTPVVNWQSIADSVVVSGMYKQEVVPDESDVNRFVDGQRIVDRGNYSSTKYLYKNPTATFNKKTFSWDEVYSFAFYPILTSGEASFAFHIQAPSTGVQFTYPTFSTGSYAALGTFTSTDEFTPGVPLRFHLTPRFNTLTNIVGSFDGNPNQNIHLIKLKFEITGAGATLLNTLITNKVISGWKIVQQPKNKTQNKRVVTTGIIATHSDEANIAGIFTPAIGTSPFFVPTIWNYQLGGLGRLIYGHGLNTGGKKSYPFFISPDIIENNIVTESYNQIDEVGNFSIKRNNNSSQGTDVSGYTASNPNNNFVWMEFGIGNIFLYVNSTKLTSNSTTYKYDIDQKQKIKAEAESANIRTLLSKPIRILNIEGILITTYTDYIPNNASNSTTGQSILGISQTSGGQTFVDYEINSDLYKLPFATLLQNIPNYFGRINDFEYVDLITNYLDGAISVDGTASTNTTLTDVYGGEKFWCKYAIRNRLDSFKIGADSARLTSLFYGWFLCEGNYDYKHFIRSTDVQTVGTIPYFPAEKVIVNGDGTYGVDVSPQSLGYPTGYNKQYQLNNTIVKYYPKLITFEENNNFENRHIYSETQIEVDTNDFFRVFRTNNFYDLPKHTGIITSMFIRDTILYTRTTLGLWRNYYNALTNQASKIGEVFTGTGKAFSIPSTLLTNNNMGGLQHFTASTETPYGEIWFDSASKTLWLFDSQLKSLNNNLDIYFKNLITATSLDYLNYASFTDNPFKSNIGITLVYDDFFKRLLIKFYGFSTTLSFSFEPEIMNWVSFHTYVNAYMLSHNKLLINSSIASGGLKLYKWYTSNSKHLVFNGTETKPFILEYVVNNGFFEDSGKRYRNNIDDTKVFDNLIIKTLYPSNTTNKTFDRLLVTNRSQSRNIGLVENDSDFAYENYNDDGSSADKGVRYINDEFRVFVPRDNTADAARFKDKYLKLRFQLNAPVISGSINLANSVKFVVYYIKNIFRVNRR